MTADTGPTRRNSELEIESVVDEGLGHSSYVVGLGDGSALVVDPARFPDRQRRLAVGRGWRIAWTADTHSHADYISGSPELAAEGATFLASAGAGLEVPHRPVDPGESVELAAGVELRAIADAGPHAGPPRVPAGRGRRAGGAVLGWVADGRRRRPDRPAR